MKLETIKNYIKYSNISYAEIYRRAKKGGLRIEIKPSGDKYLHIVTAYDKNGHFVSSCFPKAENSRDKCCANWNEYSF